MKNEYKLIARNFGPVWDSRSRVLILGSFPSPKSREAAFYYGHPRNRFWPLMANLLDEPLPETVEDKSHLVLSHGIALWDVLESCEIRGASDTSIRNAVPVDIGTVTGAAPIGHIFCNGSASHRLYCEHLQSVTGIEAVKLPSTSPANAACGMEELISSWSIIIQCLIYK